MKCAVDDLKEWVLGVKEVNAVEAGRYACDLIANGVSWADQLLTSELGGALCRKAAQGRTGHVTDAGSHTVSKAQQSKRESTLSRVKVSWSWSRSWRCLKVEMPPRLISHLARDPKLHRLALEEKTKASGT